MKMWKFRPFMSIIRWVIRDHNFSVFQPISTGKCSKINAFKTFFTSFPVQKFIELWTYRISNLDNSERLCHLLRIYVEEFNRWFFSWWRLEKKKLGRTRFIIVRWTRLYEWCACMVQQFHSRLFVVVVAAVFAAYA